MEQPSYQTRMLIDQLEALPLEKRDMFGRSDQETLAAGIDLIRRIESHGEWPAIFYLVQYLAAHDDKLATAAGNAIEALLAGTRPNRLLQIDEHLRCGRWSLQTYLVRWDKLSRGQLDKRFPAATYVGVQGLLSCHGGGYVREAALQQLGSVKNGRELPYLLLRLSDWVWQVRLRAERLIQERLDQITPEYLQHFINNIAVVEMIGLRQRGLGETKRRELIDRITGLLKKKEHRAFLFAGLEHNDYQVRRTCLRILWQVRDVDAPEIITRLLRDKDMTNRRVALSLVLELPATEQLERLQTFARDPAPRLRRDALRALSTLDADNSRSYLENALSDQAASVREFARWQLKEFGSTIDFRQFYRDRLNGQVSTKVLAAAVAGLGETGKPEDADLLVSLLEQPQVVVRRAAVRALARLAAANHIATFVRLLSDPSPSVSAAARKALALNTHLVDLELVWQTLDASEFWHVRGNALDLLNHSSKWDRLNYALLAASHTDVRVQDRAVSYLEMWARHYGTTWQSTEPSIRQREQLRRGRQRLSRPLSKYTTDVLSECLRVHAGDAAT